MKLTNKFGLPQAVVRAIENDPYESKGSDISTTRLIDPPQVFYLWKRHGENIEVDVSERLKALKGQAKHVILERACPDTSIAEKRYTANVLGWTISGQVDLIEDGILWDYKNTTLYKYQKGDFSDFEKQANVNRWIAAQNGVEIKGLKNFLMFEDWKLSESRRKKNYPEAPGAVVELPLWSISDARAYIEERVRLFQSAAELSDEQLPYCETEERWYNNIRCQDYCSVRSVCKQWGRIREQD